MCRFRTCFKRKPGNNVVLGASQHVQTLFLYIGGWKTLPNPGKNETTNNGFGKLSLFL